MLYTTVGDAPSVSGHRGRPAVLSYTTVGDARSVSGHRGRPAVLSYTTVGDARVLVVTVAGRVIYYSRRHPSVSHDILIVCW